MSEELQVLQLFMYTHLQYIFPSVLYTMCKTLLILIHPTQIFSREAWAHTLFLRTFLTSTSISFLLQDFLWCEHAIHYTVKNSDWL